MTNKKHNIIFFNKHIFLEKILSIYKISKNFRELSRFLPAANSLINLASISL